jgi:hypothetical protein
MRLGGAGFCAAIAILGAALPAPAHAAEPAKAPAGGKAPPPPPAEDRPARPPLPELPASPALPWERHLEVGGGASIVATPATRDGDGGTTGVRLRPGPGFHVRVSWEALPYLWFTGYVVESRHPLDLPAGSLGVPGALTGGAAWMYTVGARLSPTLPLGSRARLWLTAGAGWGRLNYPRLCPREPCTGNRLVPERAASMLEIPIGLGVAFEIIPRWLRLHLELTGSLVPSQSGPALEHSQTIDGGRKLDVRPMPALDGIVTQTIGLSLVL